MKDEEIEEINTDLETIEEVDMTMNTIQEVEIGAIGIGIEIEIDQGNEVVEIEVAAKRIELVIEVEKSVIKSVEVEVIKNLIEI
jgi:hypothetical protein